MGNFVSLRIEMPRTEVLRPSALLAPCFSDPYFAPVALGALAARKAVYDWYLSGYALENFISGFIQRGAPAPASIHRFISAGSEDYLLAIADAISKKTSLADRMSPFETVEADLSYVRAARLDASVMDDADLWCAQHPQAAFYLYGSIDLAGRERAFRFFFPDDGGVIGAPLLWLRLGRSPSIPDLAEMLIYSQSQVWLESDQGTLADTNLARLAALAHSIVAPLPASTVTLHLDGSVFENERARFERALADVLKCPPQAGESP